jgi:hypothetical protein
MSLRSLLNDEPQDPISSLPPRAPSTPSTLSTLISQPSTTPLRSPNPNPNGYGGVPFPTTKAESPSQEYGRTHPVPSPAANRFLNGDAVHTGPGEPSSVTKRSKKKSTRNAFHDGVTGNPPGYSNGYDTGVPPSMDIDHSGAIPNGSAMVGDNQKTGSTGRSNLVRHMNLIVLLETNYRKDRPHLPTSSRLFLRPRVSSPHANMAAPTLSIHIKDTYETA